jgi:hypothetical protein
VQEDRADLEGLFEVAVAALDVRLLLVGAERRAGGEAPGRLVTSAEIPSAWAARSIAAWSRRQAIVGLPFASVLVWTTSSPSTAGSRILATRVSTLVDRALTDSSCSA